jgi:hypothetical protein
MNRADQIQDGGERRRNTVGFALQILQRRLASSPAAIHESLKRRLARLEGRLEEEKLLKRGQDASNSLSQRVACRPGMKKTWKKHPRMKSRRWKTKSSIRRQQPAPSPNSTPKSPHSKSSKP